MDLTLAAVVIMGGWVVAILLAGLVLTLRPGGAAVPLSITSCEVEPGGEREVVLLGGDAEVLGNPRGRVQAVRLRPASWLLLDLVLGDGLALAEKHVRPECVRSADGRLVELDDQCIDSGSDTAGIDGPSLSAGLPINSADGKRLGKLRLVSFDPDALVVNGLVVEGRGGSSDLRVLPIERVAAVAPDRATTTLRRSDWTNLDRYASDWDLERQIVERIANDQLLSPLARSITVEAHSQRVRLGGYVTSQDQIERTARIARSVPGVLAIERGIVSDDALANEVAQALGRDPRTSRAAVQVTSHFGVVDIAGDAPDQSSARAIDQVVGQVPGVQGLHNMVTSRPVAQSA